MQEREHGDPFTASYATPSQQSQQSPYPDHPATLPPHPQAPYGAYTTDSQLTEYRNDPVKPARRRLVQQLRAPAHGRQRAAVTELRPWHAWSRTSGATSRSRRGPLRGGRAHKKMDAIVQRELGVGRRQDMCSGFGRAVRAQAALPSRRRVEKGARAHGRRSLPFHSFCPSVPSTKVDAQPPSSDTDLLFSEARGNGAQLQARCRGDRTGRPQAIRVLVNTASEYGAASEAAGAAGGCNSLRLLSPAAGVGFVCARTRVSVERRVERAFCWRLSWAHVAYGVGTILIPMWFPVLALAEYRGRAGFPKAGISPRGDGMDRSSHQTIPTCIHCQYQHPYQPDIGSFSLAVLESWDIPKIYQFVRLTASQPWSNGFPCGMMGHHLGRVVDGSEGSAGNLFLVKAGCTVYNVRTCDLNSDSHFL
ncbi:hypothetical protein B0H17DRAFT_1131854 [Mycena rosella]|uniref:Uncharacterized protein n=1 Tax=Mycena rosella TaxID=1033263 RepID=A0AAD7DLI9_MYCRO|nr:hypothetical protein B0H17DRAFT_1131854 [Mycena rosella]